MSSSLQELVNAANAAALDAVYARARAESLKAAAVGAAERQIAAGVPVRELISDQGLGALRLDGLNLPPVPLVDRPEEVTSFLAERAPDLVRAVISVPVAALADALDALGYAGIAGAAARAEFRDPNEAARWISAHCKIQPDPDRAGAWNVLYIDAEGHTTPIPGMSAMRPAPTWKLLANTDLQADNKARAQSEVDEMVRQFREADAPPAQPAADPAEQDPAPAGIARGPVERFRALSAGVDAALAKRAEYHARRRAELALLCEERGLPNVGTKDELTNRLLISDGLLAPDPEPDAAAAHA